MVGRGSSRAGLGPGGSAGDTHHQTRCIVPRNARHIGGNHMSHSSHSSHASHLSHSSLPGSLEASPHPPRLTHHDSLPFSVDNGALSSNMAYVKRAHHLERRRAAGFRDRFAESKAAATRRPPHIRRFDSRQALPGRATLPRSLIAAFGRKPPLALRPLGRASGTRIVRRSAERRYASTLRQRLNPGSNPIQLYRYRNQKISSIKAN